MLLYPALLCDLKAYFSFFLLSVAVLTTEFCAERLLSGCISSNQRLEKNLASAYSSAVFDGFDYGRNLWVLSWGPVRGFQVQLGHL